MVEAVVAVAAAWAVAVVAPWVEAAVAEVVAAEAVECNGQRNYGTPFFVKILRVSSKN